jgi:hypothetical protein
LLSTIRATTSTATFSGWSSIVACSEEARDVGQAVFLLRGKVTYFVNTVFNYPTLAECYKAAAFNGLNRLS